MDLSVSLEMDRDFRDFNLCVYWEPTLSPHCTFTQSRLLQSAYRVRQGNQGDLAEFGDALKRTIRWETFQAFQKIHGPRPIDYPGWYCAKLEQFFGILLYEQLLVLGLGPHGEPGPPKTECPWEEGDRILYHRAPLIQRDAIWRAISPAEVKQIDWLSVLEKLTAAGRRGQQVLEHWLAERAARRKQKRPEVDARRPRQRVRNSRPQRTRREPRRIRDGLIRSSLEQGLPREEICKRLDDLRIPVTQAMQKRGIASWSEGWNHPNVRPGIQTLFSKAVDPD
jgi:hypothetical protein